MKISIVIPFNALTGGIKVIYSYANFFAEKGHDVVCYVPIKAYGFNYNKLKVFKATIGNIKRGTKVEWIEKKFKIKMVPVISNKYIRDAEVIIATAWPTAYDVNDLDRKKGRKFYFVQGYEIWSGEREKVKNSYRLPLEKIVVSKNLKKILRDEIKVDSKLIYNGIEKEAFIKNKKIINSKKIILMQYSQEYIKGTDKGIEILKKILKKYDVKIILFGIKKPKIIPENMEFFENPRREILMGLYQKADIYLFTSRQDSWGLPVIEAMANKCGVVATNVGCIGELCTNGKEALISYDLNYEELFEKLELAITKEELLKKIQVNGYELAKQFLWENSYLSFEKYIIDSKNNNKKDFM